MMEIMVEPFPSGMLHPEAERYFGTLLERMEYKFDLLLEVVQPLSEQVSRLEERMDRLEARLDQIDIRLTVLERSVEGILMELKKIRVELKSTVSTKQFFPLKRRVAKLEQVVAKK
jgi:chromosome segregation ATPase